MKSIAIPYLIIVLYHFYNSEYVQAKDTKGLPGHLKPLGHSGRHIEITEINGFPSLKTFFKQHVSQSKPLVMRGAAKIYPAFSKWSDDYFLSLPETSTAEIDIQQRKKQNYSLPYLRATLAEFLHRYNHTDEYMVSYIPSHLKTDLYLPPCVQCDDLIHIEPVMWLSNGGTKSILHADQNHNINCLIRGTKDFILINKDTPDQTFIDAPGTYSYVDVDRVDMDKYPVFSSIDFYDTHIEAGDCIFVPASWFHQVRSYGYNIAVNIWLKGEDKFFDVSSCQDVTKAYKTLDQFTYSLVEPPSHDGRDELDEGAEMFSLFLHKQLGDVKKIDLKTYIYLLKADAKTLEIEDNTGDQSLVKAFNMIDINKNGYITHEEIDGIREQSRENQGVILELMNSWNAAETERLRAKGDINNGGSQENENHEEL